jgi:hypothetical protein
VFGIVQTGKTIICGKQWQQDFCVDEQGKPVFTSSYETETIL